MAGRFLSLEEVARQLGVSEAEVNRHVDRKRLFPMRDGATLKFKVDDVERLIRDLADEGQQPAEFELGDEIGPGDSLFADGDQATAAPDTIVRGADVREDVVEIGSGLSVSGISGGSVAGGGSLVLPPADDELALESIVGASSISGSNPPRSGVTGGPGDVAETFGVDFGDAEPVVGAGSLVIGAEGTMPGAAESTGAGLAISGPLDSGLSLDDGTIAMSGIDLGGDGAASAEDGTLLGGDDFELGGKAGGDEESASVVIAESESTESSFFGRAIEGEGSSAFGDESAGLPSSIASEAMQMPGDFTPEMAFSGLQLAGLICCSLLLLFGGFIAYDLVRTIGSPESTTLANPLLDAMAGTFGWR